MDEATLVQSTQQALNEIVALKLSNRQLKSIDPCLQKCTKLKSLDVSFNQLRRLEHVDQCIELRELKVNGNQIDKVFGLDRCSQLELLSFSDNPLTADALVSGSIGRLPKLQTLLMVRVQLQGKLPTSLWSKSLQRLDVSANQITSLSGIEVCTHLAELNASHNSLIDVAPTLASMSELIELNVSHNNIRSMSGFPALKALMILNISHNQLSSFENFPALPSLAELHCSNNGLRLAPIAASLVSQTPHLEVLDLRNNKIDLNKLPDVLAPCRSMRSLRELSISGNPFCTQLNVNSGAAIFTSGSGGSDSIRPMYPQSKAPLPQSLASALQAFAQQNNLSEYTVLLAESLPMLRLLDGLALRRIHAAAASSPRSADVDEIDEAEDAAVLEEMVEMGLLGAADLDEEQLARAMAAGLGIDLHDDDIDISRARKPMPSSTLDSESDSDGDLSNDDMPDDLEPNQTIASSPKSAAANSSNSVAPPRTSQGNSQGTSASQSRLNTTSSTKAAGLFAPLPGTATAPPIFQPVIPPSHRGGSKPSTSQQSVQQVTKPLTGSTKPPLQPAVSSTAPRGTARSNATSSVAAAVAQAANSLKQSPTNARKSETNHASAVPTAKASISAVSALNKKPVELEPAHVNAPISLSLKSVIPVAAESASSRSNVGVYHGFARPGSASGPPVMRPLSARPDGNEHSTRPMSSRGVVRPPSAAKGSSDVGITGVFNNGKVQLAADRAAKSLLEQQSVLSDTRQRMHSLLESTRGNLDTSIPVSSARSLLIPSEPVADPTAPTPKARLASMKSSFASSVANEPSKGSTEATNQNTARQAEQQAVQAATDALSRKHQQELKQLEDAANKASIEQRERERVWAEKRAARLQRWQQRTQPVNQLSDSRQSESRTNDQDDDDDEDLHDLDLDDEAAVEAARLKIKARKAEKQQAKAVLVQATTHVEPEPVVAALASSTVVPAMNVTNSEPDESEALVANSEVQTRIDGVMSRVRQRLGRLSSASEQILFQRPSVVPVVPATMPAVDVPAPALPVAQPAAADNKLARPSSRSGRLSAALRFGAQSSPTHGNTNIPQAVRPASRAQQPGGNTRLAKALFDSEQLQQTTNVSNTQTADDEDEIDIKLRESLALLHAAAQRTRSYVENAKFPEQSRNQEIAALPSVAESSTVEREGDEEEVQEFEQQLADDVRVQQRQDNQVLNAQMDALQRRMTHQREMRERQQAVTQSSEIRRRRLEEAEAGVYEDNEEDDNDIGVSTVNELERDLHEEEQAELQLLAADSQRVEQLFPRPLSARRPFDDVSDAVATPRATGAGFTRFRIPLKPATESSLPSARTLAAASVPVQPAQPVPMTQPVTTSTDKVGAVQSFNASQLFRRAKK